MPGGNHFTGRVTGSFFKLFPASTLDKQTYGSIFVLPVQNEDSDVLYLMQHVHAKYRASYLGTTLITRPTQALALHEPPPLPGGFLSPPTKQPHRGTIVAGPL